MSADQDGDSRMASSPEDSDNDLATPAEQLINPASTILSPPDSQHHHQAMPTSAPGVSGANANGKRPIQTISNGTDDDLEILGGSSAAAAPTATGAKARQDFAPRTHKPSGYTWSRTEDEPGHAWTNKKALDENQRAWEALVHKDMMVKSEFDSVLCSQRAWELGLTSGATDRYGDPFEAVEKERAVLASLQQR